MIFKEEAKHLLVQYQVAREEEGTAITSLNEAMKNGINEIDLLNSLTDNMITSHNKSMDIWDQLQVHIRIRR
jgi:hypothetical protein